MIYGLTHNTDNVPIQRLAVAFKVSIGIPGTDGKNYPEKLDHFRIVAKNPKGEWVEHPGITEKLVEKYTREVPLPEGGTRRSKLVEFDIVFLQDPSKVTLPDGSLAWTMDNVFRTEFAWWTAAERRCYGNGLTAMRKISALPEKERAQHAGVEQIEWKPCGDTCPQMKSGECKPNGVLSFVFKDHPVIGSIAQFKTTSYESIARIMSSLMQITEMTGGRLRGIPLKMVLRAGTTRYEGPDGKKKKGTAYFVNIEFREIDYKNLVSSLLEESANYQKTLGSVKMLTEHNDEDEVIDTEVVAETTSDTAHQSTPPAATPGIDTVFAEECGKYELNAAQRDACVNAFNGNKASALVWLQSFNKMAAKSGKTPIKIREIFTRGLLQPGAVSQMLAEAEPVPPAKKGTRTVKAETTTNPPPAATPVPAATTVAPSAQTITPPPPGTWEGF